MRPPLIIATTNSGKFREFCALLGELPIQLLSLAEFSHPPTVAEDDASYAANAARKALTIARWSSLPALADDSGLEVDALGGAPGVHSARYAGPAQDSKANVAKLLHALHEVPAERTACFRCVIVVAAPDGAMLTAEGVCSGQIIDVPRGHAGFGYDPVFLDLRSGLTFAEMSAAAKHEVSHRARACALLRSKLVAFLSAHSSAAGSLP